MAERGVYFERTFNVTLRGAAGLTMAQLADRIREVGYAPRFLHIDGAWRDHRIYAITVEECPDGMLARLSQQSHE